MMKEHLLSCLCFDYLGSNVFKFDLLIFSDEVGLDWIGLDLNRIDNSGHDTIT